MFPGAGSYVPLTSDPWKWFTSLILPWLVLAAGNAAVYARLIRGSLIEVMGEDYIRTARAKGLRERRVVLRHGAALGDQPDHDDLRAGHRRCCWAARCSMETVFDIPGIGRLNYDAITHADFPIVAGHGAAGRAVHHRRQHPRGHRLRLLDPRVRFS